MRDIDLIVLHCSATLEGKPFRARDIDAMHRRQGWNGIGYHWVIGVEGLLERGRDEAAIGAHVAGHNARSIGVCYIGGIGANGRPKDTRTPAQLATMKRLIAELLARYPRARVLGHRDLSPDCDGDGQVEPLEWLKACPCFDARAWLLASNLPLKGIAA